MGGHCEPVLVVRQRKGVSLPLLPLLAWTADINTTGRVGGIIASQIAPFGDPNVMGAWGACEATVYGGLEG